MAKNWKDISRGNWASNHEEDSTDAREKTKIGALQRIADACELMVKDREDLIKQLEYARDISRMRLDHWEREKNSNRALRGVITKLKNKIREYEKRDNLDRRNCLPSSANTGGGQNNG